MSLNVYFSVIGDSDVTASITDATSKTEVQNQLKQAGSDDERILAFISWEGEAVGAIQALALVNIECEGSIGGALEKLLADAFNSGESRGLAAMTMLGPFLSDPPNGD